MSVPCPSCTRPVADDWNYCLACCARLDPDPTRPPMPKGGMSTGVILLIVGGVLVVGIGFIAVVAAIAIPNLLAAKLSANETAAIATLRNLASCQAQIQTSGKIDVDQDGIGEYGTFLDMTGSVGARLDAAWEEDGNPLNPPILSPALANVDLNGIVTKSGYAFVIYLPDDSGGWVCESGPAGGFTGGSGVVGVDLSEERWCAYAWPVAHGNSGNRAFFVSHAGDVMQADNSKTRWQGVMQPIPPDSALIGSGPGARMAVGVEGTDGNVWKVVN